MILKNIGNDYLLKTKKKVNVNYASTTNLIKNTYERCFFKKIKIQSACHTSYN